LERTCAQYERDPAPILRHDPNFGEEITTSLPAPSGLSYKDKAELYRIQTEESWGRWLWLVAELVPHGKLHCLIHSLCHNSELCTVHALAVFHLNLCSLISGHLTVNSVLDDKAHYGWQLQVLNCLTEPPFLLKTFGPSFRQPVHAMVACIAKVLTSAL